MSYDLEEVIVMSVVDSTVVDGIALTEDKNGIVLLITDHLDWSEEYQHLMTLQEKINTYLGFLEEKQYEVKTDSQSSIRYSLSSLNIRRKPDTETGEKMERAMDDIREKFGRNAITFGRILKNDIGLESIKKPEDSK